MESKEASRAKEAAKETAKTVKEGEIPSNVEVTRVLETTKQAIAEQEQKGHPGLQAHKVMEDAQQVLESAKQLIEEKNKGEIFQKFVKDTKEAVRTAPVPSTQELQSKWKNQEGKFVIPEQLQREAMDTAQNLKVVALEMVRSAEFRNLILEFLALLEETGGNFIQEKQEKYFPERTGATPMQGVTQPAPMQGVTQPTPMQGFTPEGKWEMLESSRFGEPFPSEFPAGQRQPFPEEPQQPYFGKETFPVTGQPGPVQRPSEEGMLGQPATEFKGYGTFEQRFPAQEGFERAFTPSERPIDQGVKELGKELVSDVKQGRVYIPEERKQELNRKFRDLIGKLTRNGNLNRATRGLIFLFEDIRDQLRGTVQEAKEKVEEVAPSAEQLDEHTKQVREDAKELIGQFTGREELDQFIDRLKNVFYQIKDDQELNGYLDQVRNYILETAENPSLLDNESHTNRVNDFLDRGRDIYYRLKNQEDIRKLSKDGQRLLNNIKEDETTQRLAESLRKLVTDFACDTRGAPSAFIAADTLNQLRAFLVPVILENIKMIQLPRIEGSDEKYDFVLENVTFNGSDIMPDRVQIKTGTDINVNLKELALEESVVSDVQLVMKDIESHMKNVEFWFKRKTFPKMEDEGRADVDIQSGTWIIVHWEIIAAPKDQKEQPLRIRAKKIQVHLGGIKIKVKEAKHDTLLNIFTGLFSGAIRKRVENRLATNLFELINGLDDKINKLIQNPAALAQDIKESVTSALPTAQHFVETGAVDVSGQMEGNKKVEEKSRTTTTSTPATIGSR